MEYNNQIQHVYLYMDDSGKISKYEDYAIFAGIVFHTNKEKSEFVNKYRSICKDINCNYCNKFEWECDNECPEIKANHISNGHRRRFMQLSKKYTTFGTVIYNKNLKSDIVNRKASKGRFSEYAQRRLIKMTIKHLISLGAILPDQPIYLHINIDEMPTKSNGYYTLQEGLYEELKHGIINWNYGKTFKPIVFGDLQVQVTYKDSKYDYGIQMADIIANTIRRTFVFNNNWFDSYNYVLNNLKIDIFLRLPN